MDVPHRNIPDVTAPIHFLQIQDVFESLSPEEQLYAHHLSMAAWEGFRIILRQTSPESESIFDFIIALYKSCGGKLEDLDKVCRITKTERDSFLAYAGLFLHNLGNFYGEGGQKFVPDLPRESLKKIIKKSGVWEKARILEGMTSTTHHSLGYPSGKFTSGYYAGNHITKDEIATIAKVMDKEGIEPENTRIKKSKWGNRCIFKVTQASVKRSFSRVRSNLPPKMSLHIVGGDHRKEMFAICWHLGEASKHTNSPLQKDTLRAYIASFQTGNLSDFRRSQELWVQDTSPSIENILGFVESYRDPHGVRAEWEGVVCISDSAETDKVKAFANNAGAFSKLLPWATDENDGKGPFEKKLLDIPNVSIMHALTVCCPYVWEASNLPNYNDIREECGSKNIILANRMSVNRASEGSSRYLNPSAAGRYMRNLHIIRFVATVVHELLGHGTGKLLRETKSGEFNFDRNNPPINPLTNEKISTWYLPGETWTGKFQDIACAVEECRAILMSAYLIDNKDLLRIFGYHETSLLRADELIYLSYLHLGVEGIRSLEHFCQEDGVWKQAHSQGYFAIFRYLLENADGVFSVDFEPEKSRLSVSVDRSKIISVGKKAIGELMCSLHVWRCTADVKACREFFLGLTDVTGKYSNWRELVFSKPEARCKFVQANSMIRDGEVVVNPYRAIDAGIVESWADRVDELKSYKPHTTLSLLKLELDTFRQFVVGSVKGFWE